MWKLPISEVLLEFGKSEPYFGDLPYSDITSEIFHLMDFGDEPTSDITSEIFHHMDFGKKPTYELRR